MNNTDRQSIATFSCGVGKHDVHWRPGHYAETCQRCGMTAPAMRLETADPVRAASLSGLQQDKAAIDAELRPRFADPFIQTAVEMVRASGNFIINGTDVMVQDRNAPGGAVLIHVTRTMLDDPRNCGLLLEESSCKHCGSLVCDCDQYIWAYRYRLRNGVQKWACVDEDAGDQRASVVRFREKAAKGDAASGITQGPVQRLSEPPYDFCGEPMLDIDFGSLQRAAEKDIVESVPWWKRKLWHLGARIESFGLKVQGWAE